MNENLQHPTILNDLPRDTWKLEETKSFANVTFQHRGLDFVELWANEVLTTKGADVIRYRNQRYPKNRGSSKQILTLCIDLSFDPDTLFNNLNATARNEVRRCLNKDKKVIRHYYPVSRDVFEEFFKFHSKFAKLKGFAPLDEKLFYGYLSAQRIALSVAYCDETHRVWHAYVCGNGWSRLVASASSIFTLSTQQSRQLLGRLNKALHWADMLLLRDSGVKIYDFGGWGTPDQYGTINQFKGQFGGDIVATYDTLNAATFKGLAYLIGRKIFQKS
jgi:hypothetical protein